MHSCALKRSTTPHLPARKWSAWQANSSRPIEPVRRLSVKEHHGNQPEEFPRATFTDFTPSRFARALSRRATPKLCLNRPRRKWEHFLSIGTRWRNKSLRLNSSNADQISAGTSCGGVTFGLPWLSMEVDVEVDLLGLQPASPDGWQAGRTLPPTVQHAHRLRKLG